MLATLAISFIFQMVEISRNRLKLTELVPIPDGPGGRGRTLRVLFAHSCVASVKRCVRELASANFKVSADVVLSSAQLAKRLSI